MIIDLIHNKIVADTMTASFKECVEKTLVPTLVEKYGDTEIVGIQMYEDYISDNFMKNGYWYYPLTVVTAEGCFTEWVKWAVNADNFDSCLPYSYIGEGEIDFKLTTNVPTDFEDKLVGRARFCEGGVIKLNVETSAPDITKLSGKYSQTFVDELARQITAAIGKAMSVEGLAEGDLELSLVFAPGTYMEHISENVTYRRLILSDKASAPRDFWIKWTRLDGAVAYSVASNVDAENILFELGEDVPQKVREKEYRYLVQAGKDKYHNAMGRKNVTEWREIIKRAIRRGDLVKLEKPVELAPETRELEEKLADVLGRAGVAVPETHEAEIVSAPAQDEEFERAMQKMREVANAETPEDEVATPVIPTEEETDEAEEPAELVLTEESAEEIEEEEAELILEEVTDEESEDDEEELELAGEDEENTSEDEEAELVLEEEAEETEEETEKPEAEESVEETEEAKSDSEEIVYDTADEADEENVAEAAPEVEFFDEEEDEEEELDELEALYADDDSALYVSEGAVPANDEEAAELDEITRLAMEALKEIQARANAETAEAAESEEKSDDEFEDIIDEEALSESDCEVEDEEEAEALAELRMLEPDDEAEELSETAEAVESVEDAVSDAAEEAETAEEASVNAEMPEATEAITEEPILEDAPVISSEREQDIRSEVEAKIRLEYESRARRAAEDEAARLRREMETMRIENERLLAEARRENEKLRAQYEQLLADTQRINAEREAKDKARRIEEEKLRTQIETQLRQEARERERLAEAARMAIEEQRRLEEESLRREAERAEEERRIEEEKRRREAEARANAEREAEAERIRLEEEAAKAAAAAMPSAGDGKYSYTSKTVKFIFRKSVDPNITARIHEIIKAAIEYYGKDKVFMKIRATVPDSQTVNLEFLQIPIEEMELLSNLIKILGNSGLGIAKAIVE